MVSQTFTREATAWLSQRCADAGFTLAGIASVPEPASYEAEESRRRFAEWIDAGHAGEMEWLKRPDAEGNLLRSNLHVVMPWARSVIVCAANYNADAPRSIEPYAADSGWIAKYSWSGEPVDAEGEMPGSDYHDVLLTRLHGLEAEVRAHFGGACDTRCYVDTGPIIERGYAERAGVGWIGKNTCVINQDAGSWLLLGVIVTSLPLAPDVAVVAAPDRCGSCTRCIDACPTDALFGERQMDASRCIAYLTIEKKGAIAEDFREAMGRHVFGCDICQEVCPWNRRAPIAAEDLLSPRLALVNPSLQWLAEMDSAAFKRWFRGSPLERTGRKRLQRNVAIAMGNSGEKKFLPKLIEWKTGDDEVLAATAEWAIVKIGT